MKKVLFLNNITVAILLHFYLDESFWLKCLLLLNKEAHVGHWYEGHSKSYFVKWVFITYQTKSKTLIAFLQSTLLHILNNFRNGLTTFGTLLKIHFQKDLWEF